MKELQLRLAGLFCLSAFVLQLNAQYAFFNPKGAFAIEVSLPNTALVRLPINRNAISSLAVVGDYIIGGTCAVAGEAPFLFSASISEKKMVAAYDVDSIIVGQRSIKTGFSVGEGNVLYAGTMMNRSELHDHATGGHLIVVDVGEKGEIAVEDLGVPISGEGIHALTINKEKTILYGISHPSGFFFAYDIATKETKKYPDLLVNDKDRQTISEYALLPASYLCKALIKDDEGNIYGSAPINRLFHFDPINEQFVFLEKSIPEVWGRRAMGAVESWTKHDGVLYGGNVGDGQLFSLDPATGRIKNMGKPIMMNRMRGLTFGHDAKIYGIAGAAPGYTHLFSYSEDEGFVDLGNPEFVMRAPGIEQGINWRGFQLGTIVSSEDGKYIVMGEDESLSQLLVFPVESVE